MFWRECGRYLADPAHPSPPPHRKRHHRYSYYYCYYYSYSFYSYCPHPPQINMSSVFLVETLQGTARGMGLGRFTFLPLTVLQFYWMWRIVLVVKRKFSPSVSAPRKKLD